jgi:hypothetical protein
MVSIKKRIDSEKGCQIWQPFLFSAKAVEKNFYTKGNLTIMVL